MRVERVSQVLRSFIRGRSVSPLWIIIAGSLICHGCGGEDWQAETYPVQGRITINAEPAAGAVITLHPVGEEVDKRESKPWAIVRDDGSFTLTTYERGDGAPPGEYKVTLKWPPDVSDLSGAMTDRLGGAYSTPERSQWTVTVSEGGNELPPIEITGAQVLSTEQLQMPGKAPPGPGTDGAMTTQGR